MKTSRPFLTMPVTSAGFSDVTDNLGNSMASDTLDPPNVLVTWPVAEEGFAAVMRFGNADLTTPMNAWANNGRGWQRPR